MCGPCASIAPFFNVDVSSFVAGIGAGTLRSIFFSAAANDRFADAAMLTQGSNAVDTSFAGVETDEPGLPLTPMFGSVWYRLSPGLGALALSTGLTFGQAHQVSIYTGSTLGALSLVGRAATAGYPLGAGSQVDLSVGTGCETYFVQVVGHSVLGSPDGRWSLFDAAGGVGLLDQQFQATPLVNDDFATAATLAVGRTDLPDRWWTCASAQTGEPAHGGAPAARSLWYRATVASGRVTVNSPGNRVAVYRDGATLTGLTRVIMRVPSGRRLRHSRRDLPDRGRRRERDDDRPHPQSRRGRGRHGRNPEHGQSTDRRHRGRSARDDDQRHDHEREVDLRDGGEHGAERMVVPGWKAEISAPALDPPPPILDPHTITFRIDGSLVPDADLLPPFTGPVSAGLRPQSSRTVAHSRSPQAARRPRVPILVCLAGARRQSGGKTNRTA